MISLRMPKGDSSAYLELYPSVECILGPYPLNGDYSDIQIETAGDFISTTPALFGENNVDHTKTTGLLYGNPLAYGTRRSPSETYPQRTEKIINGVKKEYYWPVVIGRKTLVSPANSSSLWLRHWMGNLSEMTHYQMAISKSNFETPSKVIPKGTGIGITRVVVFDIQFDPKTLRFSYKQETQTSSLLIPAGSNVTWGAYSPTNLPAMFTRGEVSKVYPSSKNVLGHIVGNALSVREMQTTINKTLSHISHVPSFQHKHPGSLALEASKDISANGANMYEFLIELRNPKQLIPKLKKLGTLKNAAENYLTLNYGILPTISDLKEIFGAFSKARFYDKNNFSVVTAVDTDRRTTKRGIEFTSTQRMKLAVGNNDSKLEEILTSMENIGMLPTFSNLWDLIPFSFVIDWFVNVGEVLEGIDQRLRLDRLNIRYVTQSSKIVALANIADANDSYMVGELQQVRYSRWTTNHSPVPPLFEPKSPTVQQHWLEAGALIIANRK